MSSDFTCILLAPTPFKGSMSSIQALQWIHETLQQCFLNTMVHTESCPLADGGDATLSVLRYQNPLLETYIASVTGPLANQQVSAEFLYNNEQEHLIVEAAQCHGLVQLPNHTLAPMDSTSYGVGELIQKSLQQFPQTKTLTITLGGSASTDGGAGALQALGMQITELNQQALIAPVSGGQLRNIEHVDLCFSLPPLSINIVTDVTHPLLGPQGCARIFSPQKGATPEQVLLLEQGLTQWAHCLKQSSGQDHTNYPGAGAAGGLGFGLSYLPNARFVSGSQWLAEQLQLKSKILRSQVIITGEGMLDLTSLQGKAIGHLLELAQDKPVFIFCGECDPHLTLPPSVHVYPLIQGPTTLKEAMANPKPLLQQRVLEALPHIQAILSDR